jgi:hypothetical protein
MSDVWEEAETPLERQASEARRVADRVGAPEGVERPQLVAAAFAVLADGLPPRPGIVWAEARARAEMATPAAREAWAAALAELEHRLPSATFELWVAPLILLGERHDLLAGGQLFVTGPLRVRTWVGRRYLAPLGDVVRDVSQFVGIRLVPLTARMVPRSTIERPAVTS